MGKSIADVLAMDVEEGLAFFCEYPNIKGILQTLHDVGLKYIKLGQSALALSGGEGGYIIAQGAPEEISKVKNSYTGKYLVLI